MVKVPAFPHGPSTFGLADRAVLKPVGASGPNSLEFFGVGFTTTIKLGDKLETNIWEIGTAEVSFEMKDLATGKGGYTNSITLPKRGMATHKVHNRHCVAG
jgi:hypothetical protein